MLATIIFRLQMFMHKLQYYAEDAEMEPIWMSWQILAIIVLCYAINAMEPTEHRNVQLAIKILVGWLTNPMAFVDLKYTHRTIKRSLISTTEITWTFTQDKEHPLAINRTY